MTPGEGRRTGRSLVPIEHLLFDGAEKPVAGALRPDPTGPGPGLEFRFGDAEKFQA